MNYLAIFIGLKLAASKRTTERMTERITLNEPTYETNSVSEYIDNLPKNIDTIIASESPLRANEATDECSVINDATSECDNRSEAARECDSKNATGECNVISEAARECDSKIDATGECNVISEAARECDSRNDAARECSGRGLLFYRNWWEKKIVDIFCSGQILRGTPIFTEQDTLRVVNQSHSYFIPMGKIDFIRTDDGLKFEN